MKRYSTPHTSRGNCESTPFKDNGITLLCTDSVRPPSIHSWSHQRVFNTGDSFPSTLDIQVLWCLSCKWSNIKNANRWRLAMTQPTHASLSSLNKHAVAAFCSFVLLIAATTAHAQDCYTDPEDWVASSWHQNNLMYWDGLDRKSINLGDPTILKLQDATGQTWFFITGPDSGQNLPYPDIDSQQNRRIGATNYVIYRSTNLVDWYLHSYVFNRDTQGTHSWDMDTVFMPEPGIPNNPDRFFKRLGSPHLYYNPNNGDDYIYLTFSASQLYDPGVDIGTPGDNNLDNDYYDPPANQNPILDNDLDADNNEDPIDADSDHLIEQQKTCFVLWTEKSRFLQGNLSWTG